MKYPGKIVITDNKVKFEYCKLENPTKEMFKCHSVLIQEKAYNRAMKEYKASKRIIEVSNVKIFHGQFKNFYIFSNMSGTPKDGQRCEAEVKDKVATIIKLN